MADENKEVVENIETAESQDTPETNEAAEAPEAVAEETTETTKPSAKAEAKPEPVAEVVKEAAPKVAKEAAPKAEPETAEAEEAPEADAEEHPAATSARSNYKWPEGTFAERSAAIHPLDTFDWDSIGKRTETYTAAAREEMETMYNATIAAIVEHEVVDGTVVSKSKKEVVINIGYKSEGVVPAGEFRYNSNLTAGDIVEVYVEQQEDRNGQLVLSHKKARTMRAWDRVNAALENEDIVTGFVKCRTKGGLIADVFGIEAFLPGSQIDVKPIRDYDMYVGKSMEFKVVKINHEFKNVVVSHKALIEQELEAQKTQIISKLEKGQVLEGTVKNITSYGVFIDLGGVDGLIHITDLSWGRINHPEEVVELDQKLNVVILDFDDDKKRIALGLKQLSSHPWDALDEKINVGDTLKGRVVVLADYGAFVEIAPGVEGLIHVSEMSWSQHLRTAQDFFKVNDEVDAVVMTLDREDRKMSLSTRRLTPDPWEDIEKKFPVESRHTGRVTNLSNFGVFVELAEGIDGLVHISDLSWSKKVNHPSEFTSVGSEIEIVVLEIDKENRRLSLGHKQLEENPWEVFATVFTVGSDHDGTIISKTDKGAIVSLPYGVEGFVPNRHLAKEDGSKAAVEDQLPFKVLEFNAESRRILLSHTNTYSTAPAKDGDDRKERSSSRKRPEANRAATEYNTGAKETTTLGDASGSLAGLKEQMEAAEAGPAKAKAPKAKKEETPKAAKEADKAEVEAPKAEAKAEAPKAEAKAEAPKAEAKAEAPKAEAEAEADTKPAKATKAKDEAPVAEDAADATDEAKDDAADAAKDEETKA